MSTTSEAIVSEGAVTVQEAVKWSGMGRSALYAAMTDGKLPYIKVGKRRLVPRAALKVFLSDCVEGVREPATPRRTKYGVSERDLDRLLEELRAKPDLQRVLAAEMGWTHPSQT